MNTPAHLLIGAAAFGHPDRPGTRRAALLGSLLPDASLYILAGVSLFLLDIPPQVVFDELYFSEGWQTIFRIDNSFLVWGMGLVIAVAARSSVGLAFTGAGLLHLLTDFLLHNDDARAHFWPLTDWRYVSPVSYWDSAHHAAVAGPVLAVCAIAAGLYLLHRDAGWGWRLLWTALIGLELFTLWNWLAYF